MLSHLLTFWRRKRFNKRSYTSLFVTSPRWISFHNQHWLKGCYVAFCPSEKYIFRWFINFKFQRRMDTDDGVPNSSVILENVKKNAQNSFGISKSEVAWDSLLTRHNKRSPSQHFTWTFKISMRKCCLKRGHCLLSFNKSVLRDDPERNAWRYLDKIKRIFSCDTWQWMKYELITTVQSQIGSEPSKHNRRKQSKLTKKVKLIKQL